MLDPLLKNKEAILKLIRRNDETKSGRLCCSSLEGGVSSNRRTESWSGVFRKSANKWGMDFCADHKNRMRVLLFFHSGFAIGNGVHYNYGKTEPEQEKIP